MKPILALLLTLLLTLAAFAAEKPVVMKDLPAAVQKTFQEQSRNAQIKGITKETENGKTEYELETIVNGRHRDLSVDANGAIVSVEEETPIDSIPAPAKAAILKKAADGKVTMVETVSEHGQTLYEAAYTTKGGKKREVLVTANGAPAKD